MRAPPNTLPDAWNALAALQSRKAGTSRPWQTAGQASSTSSGSTRQCTATGMASSQQQLTASNLTMLHYAAFDSRTAVFCACAYNQLGGAAWPVERHSACRQPPSPHGHAASLIAESLQDGAGWRTCSITAVLCGPPCCSALQPQSAGPQLQPAQAVQTACY